LVVIFSQRYLEGIVDLSSLPNSVIL
jgi:hypothetical protein